MRSRLLLAALAIFLGACTKEELKPQAPAHFKADPATAGVIKGSVRYTGAKPAAKWIVMDQDAACAKLHAGGKVEEQRLMLGADGAVGNVFIYLKSGLEGKSFEVPGQPVVIDQKGCWFGPRVLGLQAGQQLKVTNSDPVTHNIHPQAVNNREWNQSQSPEEPPIVRKFGRPEIMIQVKCNVHKWMRAWIGVVEHPYFAVTGADGSFEIRNVPPGTYTVAAWQEAVGTQERTVTLAASGSSELQFTFKGMTDAPTQ